MSKEKFESYGYTEFYRQQIQAFNINEEGFFPARVTEVHRERYKIVTEFGESNAILKSSIFHNDENNVYPTVGDFAVVMRNPHGDDIIYKVLERKSKFSRMDTWNSKEQIVAANFDYVFIITSLNHDFNIKKMERYLASAWQSGGTPIIILTKSDLCPDYSVYEAELENVAIGVPIIAVSSFTGEGLTELQNYIKPSSTIVFLGSSGVGKSSLVNAIAGEEIMKVNDIREDDSKGRHTTTHRQLIMMENGTMIIDTPGMRELGLWHVSEGLSTTFSDIEEIASRCKFRDCSHNTEPKCAVIEAIENGELSHERWNNYIKLEREARFAEKKEKVNIMLKEKSKQKNISKFQKSLKNGKREHLNTLKS